jgi:trk system potassium uptake protein TrkA
MRILIIGAGAVGFQLAEKLSEQGQDVVVIEADEDRAGSVTDQLDCIVVHGNGASVPVLQKADISKADVLLAVTSKDEVNLISSLAASRLGTRLIVARISSPEYYERSEVLSREQLGIDVMVNPERESAWETFQLLNSVAATDLVKFADGRVLLLGLRVRPDAPVAGKTLAELDRELDDRSYTSVAIVRDGKTEIPTGDSRIEEGDQIFLLSPASELSAIPGLAGYEDFVLRRVMIAGGSAEAYNLARLLEAYEIHATIIDIDRRCCVELAERLPKALVLNGDATDIELLELEGVGGVDGFVASTGHDETNMLSALLAKSLGARKVVSLVHRMDYVPLVTKVGIDAAVSPRLSTVNAILGYVKGRRVLRIATLKGSGAEAMEIIVGADSRIVGKPLKEAHLPKGSVIGAIVRKDRVITPRGDDTIELGDHVVVVTLPDAVTEMERLLV